MNVPDCIFCQIVSGRIPCIKLYENEHVLAFLDIGPVSEGHTLIIPKKHSSSVDQTDPLVMAEIAKVIPNIAASIKKTMVADGYNVICNNGVAAGQVVQHVHFHVIPRKVDDGVFGRWASFQYPDGKADELAKKIKQNLSL